MLKQLKFLQLATSGKRSLSDDHGLIRVVNGIGHATNGEYMASIPLPIDIYCAFPAHTMINAISLLGDDAKIIEKKSHLLITDGKSMVKVPKVIIDYPLPKDIEGEAISIDSKDMEAIKSVLPFTGDAIGRPFMSCIQVDGYAYATTGSTIVRAVCNLPRMIIEHSTMAIILHDMPLTMVDDGGHQLAFKYEHGGKLTVKLSSAKMPNMENFFDNWPKDMDEIKDDTRKALKGITPFLEDHEAVHFNAGTLSTSRDINNSAAVLPIQGGIMECSFSIKKISDAFKVATHCKLMSDKPSLFEGKGIQGVTIGLRKS